MDTRPHLRDCYDLCCNRVRAPRYVDEAKIDEGKKAKLEQLDERRSRLNTVSKGLCDILQMKDFLISAINFGTQNLRESRDSTTNLEKRQPCPTRPDTDFEEELINSRLASALTDPSTNILADSLKRINEAILQSDVDSPSVSQEPAVFYRVTSLESHTSHDSCIGFWSARGLPDHDFDPPSKYEFTSHVEGTIFRSPYISLTTNPGFACKYGTYNGRFVYEIDAAKLRQMKIHVQSTPDIIIAREWNIRYKGPDPGRLHYVFDAHWLASFWIPANCMKVHSFREFREKCIKAGFVDEKTNKAIETGLPLDAHEKLAIFLKPKEGVYQEFVTDSDDETIQSARPLTPDVPKSKSANGYEEPEEQPSPKSHIQASVGPQRPGSVVNPKPADDKPTTNVRPGWRPARHSKPSKVSDDNVGDTSTTVQNTAPADSGLEQSLQALSMNDS